jgi:hypothetical protein
VGEIGNRCLECGAEYQPGQEICAVCNAVLSQVRVMTEAEREQFGGMTIEQDENFRYHSQNDKFGSSSRIYVRHAKFNLGGIGLIPRLLFGAGIVALIMLVALPVVLIILAATVFGWLVFRRR